MTRFEAVDDKNVNVDAIQRYLEQQFPNCIIAHWLDKYPRAIGFSIDANGGSPLHSAIFPLEWFDNQTAETIAKFLSSSDLSGVLRAAGQTPLTMRKP